MVAQRRAGPRPRPVRHDVAPMPFVLALDQGTTSSRAVVFDHGGAVRGMAQQELRQIYPEPGWVEHDPTEIWATQSGALHEALAKAGIARPRRRGHRHHEPARDDAPLGTRDGAPARERDRLAGPPHRADVRRAPRGRPRGDVHREDGPRPRPLLLRHEAEVAARPRAGRAGARGAGRARVRHGRHVARLAAHERGRPRDRPLECEPDAALRHPHGHLGRRAPPPPRHPAGGAAARRAFVGRRRHDGARRRRRADRGHRRRPAGGPLRAGLRPARPREEHVRHGLLSPPQHGAARRRLEEPADHDRRLGPRRRPHVRPRGQRLHRGRRRAVAEGRAEAHPEGRRRRGARFERARQRGRLSSCRPSRGSARRTGTRTRGAPSSGSRAARPAAISRARRSSRSPSRAPTSSSPWRRTPASR